MIGGFEMWQAQLTKNKPYINKINPMYHYNL